MKVDAVAVVSVAAVDVEQPLRTAAVERLSRGYKFVLCDADSDVLLLAVNEGSGGHAGAIGLTPRAGFLTLGSGAVTPQCCTDRGSRRIKLARYYAQLTTQKKLCQQVLQIHVCPGCEFTVTPHKQPIKRIGKVICFSPKLCWRLECKSRALEKCAL